MDYDETQRDEPTTTVATLRRLLDAMGGAESIRQGMPRTLRISAALGWRLLVVVAVPRGLATAVVLVSGLVVPGIVIAVMQLESHVLQPLLLGRAVNLHPLAVILAIAAGLLTAGIVGALMAVPLLAVLNSGIRTLRHEADDRLRPTDTQASQSQDDVSVPTESPTPPERPVR